MRIKNMNWIAAIQMNYKRPFRYVGGLAVTDRKTSMYVRFREILARLGRSMRDNDFMNRYVL